MSDYDFSTLNDKEFEVLCADILSQVFGSRFERFKAGRDGGVDGRFYSSEGRQIVLQCKHWPNSPLARLISRLKTEELPRVRKLNPQRYVIAVSNPLSPRDKQSISDALSPHIARPDDIYGREDINDLLRAHPEVERRHYKLWIRSTGVLKHLLRKGLYDRSQFALEEILESSKRYVRTLNHDKALTVLEKYRILIIAGEPGIGKTTLAEQICCDYIADSYSLVKIADSIHEAEDSFENEENQIFLFDDFLGRNYLEALGGHEGSHIVQFIRRIQKSNNKLFVLTSRSTILNRGKMLIDTFQHHNLERNEYVLTIASLSEFEKAKILYNHVWFSGLTEEFVEEIYKERRYRKIIGHRNFNPRLIRFVTDRDRLSNCPPSKYWARIEKSLSNPADVWENPFVAQQDDYGRALVLLVTVNRRALSEEQLAAAFSLYVDASPPLNGSFDFVGSIRQLTGSLLSRTIQHGSQPQIDLFNPSIGDYVLRRYASDTAALTMAISSLRTPQALRTLRALADAKIISESATQTILEGLLDSAIAAQFVGFEEGYVSDAAWMFIKGNAESKEPSEEIKEVLEFLLSGDVPSDCTSIACLYRWGIQHALVEHSQALNFINEALHHSRDEEELHVIADLLEEVPPTSDSIDALSERLKAAIISVLSDGLTRSVAESDVLAQTPYEDYEAAEENVKDFLSDRLAEFGGLTFDQSNISEIMQDYDVHEELDDFYHSGAGEHGAQQTSRGVFRAPLDDIDDLFDRS